ncbi:hypothetical protein BZL30_8312 [Mycobacterium kansasii]|uniref:Uncharacterized protein n=1 Tax=Mycobacterium kansasii TaxID=1768 RepID=A0A1V3WHT6_MYCKA|nr:hypothetical protein BZL30_8312 [Mycobacterium kansasii]
MDQLYVAVAVTMTSCDSEMKTGGKSSTAGNAGQGPRSWAAI